MMAIFARIKPNIVFAILSITVLGLLISLMGFLLEQEGLISGNPSYAAMLEAIKTGEYDTYSQTLYDEKTHNQSRKISQNITKYQRNN